MNVTAKLVRVFKVDRQLRGLQSRLDTAERFLAQQSKLLNEINAKHDTAKAQLRQVAAAIADREGESKRLEKRVATLREQMNKAQTDKEYKAFLSEVNTFKEQQSGVEDEQLDLMARSDKLKAEIADLEQQSQERQKLVEVARSDRDKKAAEIKDRVDELKAERAALAAEVPTTPMATFERLLDTHGDEAMAAVGEQNRRRQEYTCGSCMMSIPIEAVSALLSKGNLTQCPSCGAILYIEQELAESMHSALSKH